MQIWFVLAALATAIGTIWQMVVSALSSIDAMRGFLGAYNELAREENMEILAEVPWWKWHKRRDRHRKLSHELLTVLDDTELRLSKAYDRAATGWAFLSLGAIIAAAAATWQLFLPM